MQKQKLAQDKVTQINVPADSDPWCVERLEMSADHPYIYQKAVGLDWVKPQFAGRNYSAKGKTYEFRN
jgi:predicted nucleic acid-binding Zn ribbon protein